jgi:hypothetical protein
MYSGKEIYNGFFRIGRKRISSILGKQFPDRYENKICNPLFIVGCGRSGTSMLTKLLRDHKDICSFSEANEIWDPEGYPWYRSNLNRPPIWFDAKTYFKVWREYFNNRYKKELKGIFGCYQHLSKQNIFLNKSPMNTFRILDILEMFPDSKLIHIIRDGRAVTYSWTIKQYASIEKHKEIYKKRGYYFNFNDLIKYIAKSWIEHIEEINKQKNNKNLIEKGIMLEFTYEDFCKEPNKYIDTICSFLSIDKKRFNIDDFSYIKSMNFKWKENLNENIIAEINDILASTLNKIY